MSDLMTEGAKTGTAYTITQIRRCLEGWLSDNGDNTSGTAAIHNFLLCLECDQDGIEADTKRIESRDLTEALKVAGEAATAFKALLDDMTQRAKDLAEYNDKPVELPVGNGVLFEARKSFAALERIRNQSKS